MNAQQLLEILLQASNAGIDLTTLEVVTVATVYDGDGRGELVESWPSLENVEVSDSELRI